MNVIWSPEADADVDSQLDFIRRRNPSAAGKLAAKVSKAVARIARSPFSGILRDDLGDGIRCIVVKPLVLYYWILGTDLIVGRVLHASQNVEPMSMD